MKIQICSDLHIDVNEQILERKINFNFNNIPLFIAGDIGESADVELPLLKKLNDNKIETFVVAGNHLGYDYLSNRLLYKSLGIDEPLACTKEEHLKRLTKNKLEHIHYLENSYVELDNYIVYGGTMYSNFELYGKVNIEWCQKTAERWLNDFRLVHVYDKKENMVRPIFTEDYIKLYKKFIKGLNKVLKLNKPVIVLSHFAPSILSISKEYLQRQPRFSDPGFWVNAVYANDLIKYIKNSNIKYWIHGHIHHDKDYMIGNCRVICHPYGYSKDTTIPPENFKTKIINIQ